MHGNTLLTIVHSTYIVILQGILIGFCTCFIDLELTGKGSSVAQWNK